MASIPFVSPLGTARFPKLSTPDTEGTYADNKYKVQVVLSSAGVEQFKAAAMDAAKKLFPNVDPKDVKIPLREFLNKNKDTGEKSSAGWGFEAKSKRKPLLVDSKRQPIPPGIIVGPGSEIRVSGAFGQYTATEKVRMVENGKSVTREETVHGLTLYLNAVQVKSIANGMSGGADGFGDMDGGFTVDDAMFDNVTTDTVADALDL